MNSRLPEAKMKLSDTAQPITIDEELEHTINFVKECYKSKPYFMSMIVGISKNDRYIIPFMYENSNDKHIKAQQAKKKLLKEGVTRIVFMSEAWTVAVNKGMFSPSIVPSECPNRKEMFLIHITDKDGSSRHAIMLITRIDDEVILTPNGMSDETGNLVDNLFGDIFTKGGK